MSKQKIEIIKKKRLALMKKADKLIHILNNIEYTDETSSMLVDTCDQVKKITGQIKKLNGQEFILTNEVN